jgi:hypothetical protein
LDRLNNPSASANRGFTQKQSLRKLPQNARKKADRRLEAHKRMECAGLAPTAISLDNLPNVPKDIQTIRHRADKLNGDKMFAVADELKDTCKPGEISLQYGNRLHECAMAFRERAHTPQFGTRSESTWSITQDEYVMQWGGKAQAKPVKAPSVRRPAPIYTRIYSREEIVQGLV